MHQKRKAKRRSTRTTLRLPDLDHSKNSVLQSLGSAASKRTYGAAIEDFITWYTAYPTARSTAFLRFSDDKTDELSRGYPPALHGRIRGIGGAVMPPPPPRGEGPWPHARIELFAQWMTDGYQP
jgi:hypothetical protein